MIFVYESTIHEGKRKLVYGGRVEADNARSAIIKARIATTVEAGVPDSMIKGVKIREVMASVS